VSSKRTPQDPAGPDLEDPARPRRATEDAVLTALRRIIRATDLYSRSLTQRHGLTGPQLLVLTRLATVGALTAGRLAATVALSPATITGILDRLESRHLVRRRRHDTDKRSVVVEITAPGRGAVKNAPPLLQDRFLVEFGRLEEWEQTMILSALQRIVSMMEAKDLDASPMLVSGNP
jgi:DNA-binding MarR family transcriptional regulator